MSITTGRLFLLQNSSASDDSRKSGRINGNSENCYFYTKDQRGSTVNALDSSANRMVSYQYTDFGEVSETKANGYSNFVNEIQYTGAIYDELTGLLYLNARFYDPSTGRFITQDSYRGEKNDEDTWHLYAYCANNPINYVDPSGHKMKKITIARWMVAMPIDLLAGTLGLGLIFAPIKTLCKAGGKAFTKVQFRSSVFKFAQGFQKFGHNIGECVYRALKKIPVIKKR